MANEHQELTMELHQGQTDHTIQLTATLANGKVSVTGNGGANLPHGSGSHRFNFSLTDNTGLGVTFLSLDADDNCTTCPPPSGMNSEHIHHVDIDGTSAVFTDDNGGAATSISYQWNFTCPQSNYLPIAYDPIINNGGSSISRA